MFVYCHSGDTDMPCAAEAETETAPVDLLQVKYKTKLFTDVY